MFAIIISDVLANTGGFSVRDRGGNRECLLKETENAMTQRISRLCGGEDSRVLLLQITNYSSSSFHKATTAVGEERHFRNSSEQSANFKSSQKASSILPSFILLLKAYYVLLPVLGVKNIRVGEEWGPSTEELTDWWRTYVRGLYVSRQMQ